MAAAPGQRTRRRERVPAPTASIDHAFVVGERLRRLVSARRRLGIVGLARRGFPPDVIQKLKRTFRYLLQSKMNTSAALRRIEQDRTLACAEVQYLLEFIRNSQRGVILRRATRRAEEILADES